MFIENRDITPVPNFAGKKSSGHSLLSALKDNLDNHFDSESKVIKMFLAPDIENPKKTVLISLDFGTGIAPDKIHKMFIDNYSTKNGGANRWTVNQKRRNLGRFGNGIKNVVGRMGGSILTISKIESDFIHAVEYNPSKIEISQQYTARVFKVEFGTSESMIEVLRQYWTKYMVDEDGSHVNHGTLNVFKNIDSSILRVLRTKLNYSPNQFKFSYGASFGETFENFLNQGDKLYVGTDFNNLDEVLPLSPFSGGELKEQKEYEFTTQVNGVNEKSTVTVEYYKWPKGSTHYRELTAPNAGVYIERNGRLHLNNKDKPISTELPESTIAKLQDEGIGKSNTNWIAFPTSHSRYALMRVKVIMTSDLDEIFGVNNVKTEMSFTPELDDIAKDIFKTVRKLDPFKGNGTKTPDERFACYACNKVNRKHVKQALVNTLSFVDDPQTQKIYKQVISKFTKELGQDITVL